MRKVSARSAQVIVREIEREIARLESIGRSDPDTWPDDFDQNDAPFWAATAESFTSSSGDLTIEEPHTKAIFWTLALIHPLERRKRTDLTEAEHLELETAFYELAIEAPHET